MDRVQVLKRESTAGGGDPTDEQPWDAPIEPQEDAVEAAGLYLQDVSNLDETTLIDRAGLDMRFKDGNNPGGKTLTELAASAGGGITESQHETLDTLVHDIDESSYDEVIYGSGNLVSTYIVWETAAKLKKIREEQYTYSGSKVSQSVTIQYDGTGAVKMTMTEVYTYSGNKVTSVTRTKS
jgi:hypothetical protein